MHHSEVLTKSFAVRVGEDDIGKRLDFFVTSAFPELSRSNASRLIRDGRITISGIKKKPGYRVNEDDVIDGTFETPSSVDFKPEPVDIDIVFENRLFLVINKQPGIVVHPAPGHDHGTIAHGLLHHCPEIEGVGGTRSRPGIVHRLDKDTSGIMIVAKNEFAYHYLVSQFKQRTVGKKYLGIIHGIPERDSGQVVLNIGRHAGLRKKMSVSRHKTARRAETHWTVRDTLDRLSLLEFDIKTGRTHQIRVHCAAIGHPIVGDQIYGYKKPANGFRDEPELQKIISNVPRQMLHAWQLELKHPESGEMLKFEVPMPEDMVSLIAEFKGQSGG